MITCLFVIFIVIAVVLATSLIWLGGVIVSGLIAWFYTNNKIQKLGEQELLNAPVYEVTRKDKVKLMIHDSYIDEHVKIYPARVLVTSASAVYMLLLALIMGAFENEWLEIILILLIAAGGVYLSWQLVNKVVMWRFNTAVRKLSLP